MNVYPLLLLCILPPILGYEMRRNPGQSSVPQFLLCLYLLPFIVQKQCLNGTHLLVGSLSVGINTRVSAVSARTLFE